jgi:peptidoglycan/xylan/chitin deacetylase (PgdA/CDA1 family)
MTLVRSIYKKAYYQTLNIILPKRELQLPSPYQSKRNVFIYFDYEREFSGYDTKISDAEIKEILNTLGKRKILTTWFTVGKVFNKYPDSVKNIVSGGHEIASHTYAHIPPLYTADKILEKDFDIFNKISNSIAHVIGFHSPTGRWSLKSMKYLKKFNYSYDIISCRKNKHCKPHYLFSGLNSKMMRLYTYGDDWPLFKGNTNAEMVLDHFKKLVKRIEPGNVGGIGFHPWVLYSNMEMLKGFNDLLDYLTNQDDVRLKPAQFYADLLRANDKFISQPL